MPNVYARHQCAVDTVSNQPDGVFWKSPISCRLTRTEAPSRIVRIVARTFAAAVTVNMICNPAFDYARAEHRD